MGNVFGLAPHGPLVWLAVNDPHATSSIAGPQTGAICIVIIVQLILFVGIILILNLYHSNVENHCEHGQLTDAESRVLRDISHYWIRAWTMWALLYTARLYIAYKPSPLSPEVTQAVLLFLSDLNSCYLLMLGYVLLRTTTAERRLRWARQTLPLSLAVWDGSLYLIGCLFGPVIREYDILFLSSVALAVVAPAFVGYGIYRSYGNLFAVYGSATYGIAQPVGYVAVYIMSMTIAIDGNLSSNDVARAHAISAFVVAGFGVVKIAWFWLVTSTLNTPAIAANKSPGPIMNPAVWVWIGKGCAVVGLAGVVAMPSVVGLGLSADALKNYAPIAGGILSVVLLIDIIRRNAKKRPPGNPPGGSGHSKPEQGWHSGEIANEGGHGDVPHSSSGG